MPTDPTEPINLTSALASFDEIYDARIVTTMNPGGSEEQRYRILR